MLLHRECPLPGMLFLSVLLGFKAKSKCHFLSVAFPDLLGRKTCGALAPLFGHI